MSRSREFEPGPSSSGRPMVPKMTDGVPLSGELHGVQAKSAPDGPGGFTGG